MRTLTLILFLLSFYISRSQSADELMLVRINQADSLGNPEFILKALKTLKREVQELNSSTQANYHYNLGVAHGMMYKVDSSSYHFRLSLDLATIAKDTLSMVGSWNGLGNLSRINSNNEEARANFQRALDLVIHKTQPEFTKWQSKLLGNIGGIFYDLNDPKSALSYSKKARDISKKTGDQVGAATNLIQIGYCYIELGETDSALQVNLAATRILEENADSIRLIYQYQNLGEIYKLKNETLLAKENFNRCIDLASRFHEYETQSGSLNALAEIMMSEKNLEKALSYITTSVQLSQLHGMTGHLRDAYKLQAEIERKMGNYTSALDHLFMYNELQDSIVKMDTKRSMEEFKVKYDILEKEKEIKLANAELESKHRFQRFLITLIVLIVVFSAVAILLILQKSKLKNSLLSQEIDTLRLQINGILKDEKLVELSEDQINKDLANPLSDREIQILKQAISDKTNREIADALFVSINTVKFHLKNIYEKLGVSNRNDALRMISDSF